MNEWHEHPLNPDEKVYGRLLRGGDIFLKGDVYDSTINDTWELVPLAFIDNSVYWLFDAKAVRPAEQQQRVVRNPS